MSSAAWTEVHVIGRCLRLVEFDHLQAERHHLVDGEAIVGAEPLGGRAVNGFIELDLAGFERRTAGAAFRHEAEGHRIEEGFLLAGEAIAAGALRIGRVAVIARQLDVAVRPVLDELVGAGADDLDLAGLLGGLARRIDRDRGAGRGEIVEESRLRLLQRDRDLVLAARLDRVDGGDQRGRGADLAIAFQRGDDIGGIELLAVMEGHVLADREDIGLAVGRDRHALGQLRHRLGVLVAGIERLEDMERDVARGLRRGDLRIERRRRLADADDDVAALALGQRVLSPSEHECRRESRADDDVLCHVLVPSGLMVRHVVVQA